MSPALAKDIQIGELRIQERVLYERLEGENREIARLYRQGKTREAIIREDFFLADLALYELVVDERRALERG